jgi:hypothetical protein
MPEYFCLPISTIATSNVSGNHLSIDDPVGTNDGSGTHITRGGTTVNGDIYFQKEKLPPMASIAWVELRYIARQTHVGSVTATIKPFLMVSGIRYYATTVDPDQSAYTGYLFRWDFNPATTEDWTKGAFDDAYFGFELPRDEGEFNSFQSVTSAYLVVNGIPADPGKAREIASALVRLLRRPLEFIPLTVGCSFLDNTLGDDISLLHIDHPLTQVLGKVDADGVQRTGSEGWRSLLTQYRGYTLNLARRTVDLTLRRRRGELTLLYDAAQTKASLDSIENGVLRWIGGGSFSFARASDAWNRDPATGLVVRYAHSERAFSEEGWVHEIYAEQTIVNSSFVTNLDNINGSGSGSHSREAITTHQLFREDVTGHYLRLTAGSPHNTDRVEEWTCSVSKATLLRFSLDHYDLSGFALDWQLQRDSTGEYWDEATLAWVAPVTWNAIPVASSVQRFINASAIPLDSADVVYARLRIPAGGTAGRQNWVFHIQLEDNLYGLATSWMVSDGSNVARQLSDYRATDDSGARTWNEAEGTLVLELLPGFSASDLAGGLSGQTMTLAWVKHDSNDGWFVQLQDGDLVFICQRGATTTMAYVQWVNPVRDQPSQLVVRWLPLAESQHGLPAGTMSIFLDGVKGTDAVRPEGPLAEPAATFYLGGEAENGTGFCGVVRQILSTQQTFSDAEIVAGKW